MELIISEVTPDPHEEVSECGSQVSSSEGGVGDGSLALGVERGLSVGGGLLEVGATYFVGRPIQIVSLTILMDGSSGNS